MRRVILIGFLALAAMAALFRYPKQQAGGTQMDEDRMKKALDTVDSLVRNTREGTEIVTGLQRHQDTMIVWIVGLASTAVVALPATYNYVLDLKNAPRWVLGIPIAFFVLAVFFGIILRLLFLKLLDAEGLHTLKKVIRWESLRFKHSEDEAGRKGLLGDALEILRESDPKIAAQTKTVERINGWIERLELVPFICFALGVVCAALFAVCPSLKCGALPR